MFASWTRKSALAASLLLAGAGLSPAQEPSAAPALPMAGRSALPVVVVADEKKTGEHGADEKGEKHEKHEAEQEEHEKHEEHEPENLYLRDLFRTGWDETFEERERPGRAPRFNLFKSRQGFLERIAQGRYAYTNGLEDRSTNETEIALGFEWAFNRRFGLGVEPFYTWQRRHTDEGRRGDGLRWDFGTRLQLIDTTEHAYNFQVHVVTPDSILGVRQTELSFALAAFEDLTDLGLSRVGLYHHIEYVSLLGPHGIEAALGADPGAAPVEERGASGLLRYDVSLAKTLTEPTTPLFADFTVFLEAFAQTELGGSNSGRTDLSLTPGIRFNPTGREEKAWWIQVGVEIPVTGPRPFNERFLLSIVRDF